MPRNRMSKYLHKPHFPAIVSNSSLSTLLPLARGDGFSGATDWESIPARLDLDPVEICFLRLLSDAFEPVLAFLLTPASSDSTGGVGLREDPAEVLARRTLPLRVRLFSFIIADVRR